MKGLEEGIKKRLGTDEEPFEGEVPVAEFEKEVHSIINKDKQ